MASGADVPKSNFLYVTALTVAACFLYAMGSSVRGNYGILLDAIRLNSGLSYASVSFVIAVAQLMYGVLQPLFGILAIRRSNRFALISGAVLMLVGLAATPYCSHIWQLLLVFGCILSGGTAAFSFGIIMSVVAPHMNARQEAISAGIVSSGVGLSPAIFSPIVQALVASGGLVSATTFLCWPTAILFPLILWMCARPGALTKSPQRTQAQKYGRVPIGRMFAEAFRNPAYRCLALGFFTCGFHMAIIETHIFSNMLAFGIKGHIAARVFSCYGIATIAGAIFSGFLCSRFRMSRVLGFLYGVRCPIIILLLVMPKTPLHFFFVIVLLGVSGVATVPPTSGLIKRFFGPVQLGTLFGCVYLIHQVGSFISSWLAGLSVQWTGSYTFIWCCSIALSATAAIACFSIRDSDNQKEQSTK